MNSIRLTLGFDFSASHSAGAKVLGYNYHLDATFSQALEESALRSRIDDAVMKKLQSRDLGEVDFLKGTALDGPALVTALWKELERCASPAKLDMLTLERDRLTRWSLGAVR